jgi:uncharacterized membrane protein
VANFDSLASRQWSCGIDTDPNCDRSFLSYDNFGSPFIVNGCGACHSTGLPADMRQQAPTGVNFDTLGEIRTWSRQIARTAGDGTTMPPAGGPSSSERAMLVEWLHWGAR